MHSFRLTIRIHKKKKFNAVKMTDMICRQCGSVKVFINDEMSSKHCLLIPMELRICDLGGVHFATHTTIFYTLVYYYNV